MNEYKIYADLYGHHQAIKVGWSWQAFFFSWIWALAKKIWTFGHFSLVVLLTACVFAFVIEAIVDEVWIHFSSDLLLTYLAYFIMSLSITLGINANRWQENSLFTQGYQHKETLFATTEKDAINFYTEKKANKNLWMA
jgi:hypothetical protein